jgi:hypothetical protein
MNLEIRSVVDLCVLKMSAASFAATTGDRQRAAAEGFELVGRALRLLDGIVIGCGGKLTIDRATFRFVEEQVIEGLMRASPPCPRPNKQHYRPRLPKLSRNSTRKPRIAWQTCD